jgi:SpoVK/Ycf46/Vps4 family AAA+-type ATPase
LRGKACADDIDVTILAEDDTTAGFSGAEIVAICRDAALFALEEHGQEWEQHQQQQQQQQGGQQPKLQICMRHLMTAIQTMQRQITPGMIEFYDKFRRREAIGVDQVKNLVHYHLCF